MNYDDHTLSCPSPGDWWAHASRAPDGTLHRPVEGSDQ